MCNGLPLYSLNKWTVKQEHKSNIQKLNNFHCTAKRAAPFYTQCYVARQHNGCTHLSEFQSMSLVLLSLLLVQLFCLTILSAYYQSTQALCPAGLLKDFRHFELKEALLSLIWQKIIRKSRRFSHTSVSNVEITAEGSTISILVFSMLPNPASPVSHIKYVFDWVTLACLSGGALNHWMI